jgi:glycosyltransferase involved in cell wall biosynthesis
MDTDFKTTALTQTGPAPPVVIIPAYQPDATLLHLVDALCSDPRQVVIVVDDGSTGSCQHVFDALEHRPQVRILRHAVNMGKGQALKTAFNDFLVHFDASHVGVVTADADGQHRPEDIRKVCEALTREPSSLVLGSRRLKVNVPWRSAIGNTLTRHIFQGLLGRKVTDTQTGLRGVPRAMLTDCLRIPATRYEFELEMLVRAVQAGRDIREVEIATIYDDDNRGSHFNPVLDSMRIYFVFLRFLALSLATAAIDFVIFGGAYAVTHNILGSTVIARLGAGTFNFYFAKTAVFRSRADASRELVRYVALVIWLMMVSYTVLTGLVIFVGFSVYASKIIAEALLFLASFAVQRLFVFRPAGRPAHPPAATDWNSYYSRPSRQAQVTRKITTRILLSLMRRHAPTRPRTISEFGGANSCFYVPIRDAFPDVDYLVIDNNTVGLGMLEARARHERLTTRNENLLQLAEGTVQADIVFSVGLIEHFDPAGTAMMIRKHFASVRPNGLVIITFPTPTLPYRVTRWLAELAGIWRFPDERPLTIGEVEAEVRKYATIVESRINWAIILTQGIVVARPC